MPKIVLADEESLILRLRKAVETEGDDLVRDGRLATERELMAVSGLARRTVRRALDALEKDGLVFRRQGQGTFTRPKPAGASRVASLSNRTSPAEIMEVRREIEPALSRIAALRATPADIEQMRRLAARGGEARTSGAYERWDSALHARIAESARNSLFESLFKIIQAVRVEQKWAAVRAKAFDDGLRDRLVREHLAIVEAIASRAPEAAEEAMRAHLHSVTGLLGS